MSRIRLVVLEASSWANVGSIGAEHWYGKLVAHDGKDRRSVRLKRRIADEAEAAHLNKKDGCDPLAFRWKCRDETDRFPLKADVEAAAKAEWRRHFLGHDALITGLAASADPQRPLDGSPEVLERLRDFRRRAEATGGYEKGFRAMSRVSDEYWAWLLGKEAPRARPRARERRT